MKKNIGLKIAHEPLPHHLKEIVGGDVIVMGWVHMNFKSTIFCGGGGALDACAPFSDQSNHKQKRKRRNFCL